MAMHTRRDLLRNSLLLGGALQAPRIWAAVNRAYTPNTQVLLVAGGAAFIDSVAPVFAPAPAAAAPPLAVAAAPAVAPVRTGTLAATNPAVQSSLSTAASQLQANQISFILPCAGVSQPIATWVAGAVNHAPSLLDGTACALDYNFRLLQRYDWTRGSISQVAWPGCDASSAAPAAPWITVRAVTLSAQTYSAASGAASPVPPALMSTLRSPGYWRACDFLVTSNANIDFSRIFSVSPLTLAPAAYAGTFSFVEEESRILPFEAALRTGGMLMPGQSTNIAVQYLSSDRTATFASVTLRNCLVASVAGQNIGPGGETVRRFVATLNYSDASLGIAGV